VIMPFAAGASGVPEDNVALDEWRSGQG
jgi:hypothetical protein